MGHLGQPEQLFEVKDNLAKARVVLKDISEMLKETKTLEEKIVKLTKAEKVLLKKETEPVDLNFGRGFDSRRLHQLYSL